MRLDVCDLKTAQCTKSKISFISLLIGRDEKAGKLPSYDPYLARTSLKVL